MKSQLRLRVLLPLLIVAVLGLGVSKFALGGDDEESAAATTAGQTQTAPDDPAATPTPAPADAAPADEATEKPAATPLQKALKKHKVVVVVLFAPEVAVDALATREARAGARAVGAGFLAVDVLDEQAAEAVARDSEVRSTPAIFVFKRGEELVTQLDGFADRETVAQAAANAKL